ncbi:carboxymuconolactone decarboxylase family protein [Castellaniella sp. GW247-6E4]|uniref:carboxymuconolactone decarboxylase family protein n=1 Tax=Castellaniella sp. GW247-6E4 TaxID=3140380 RepID=UPI003316152C
MSRLTIQSVETAHADAQDRLRAAQQANGFLPNLLGVLANAPTALETYQVVGAINGRNSLTPTEREVVQITAATYNGCGFCVAGHTKIAYKKLQLPEPLVEALRNIQGLSDPKLDALARFTLSVLEHKGQVPDEAIAVFKDAGYTETNALDVVLGVSLATLCNYANNLAKTPINPELQAFA